MIKKAGPLSLFLILFLFAGIVFGVLLGRSCNSATVSLSAYDRMISETATASESTATGKININTATARELTSLPGIGEVLAQNIINYRQENGPFTSIDELLLVGGIGEARLTAITDYITVGG